jgi:transposase-like protein
VVKGNRPGEDQTVGKTKRRYSAKFKAQVVLEALSGEKSPGQIAKAYGIHHNSVQLWTKRFVEKAPEVFSRETTVQEYERQIRDLEQLLGKKEVEIALLKNFLGQRG